MKRNRVGYKMKIVIIEDEIRIREGLVKLISKLENSYEIIGSAENGKAGYELVRQVKPDLVITDIKMPEMDGLEMLCCLYEEGNMPKTIVLSAYSEFEYARKAMRLGIKEYLLKPIVIGDLSAALHRVEEEIYQEKNQKQESFANVQQVFAGILWNTLEVNEPLKKWLFENYQITEETSYHVICLYLGENFEKKKESGKRDLERLLAGRKKWNYVILEAQRERGLLLLVYDCADVQELERWVQYQLLGNPNMVSGSAVGFIPNVSLEELKKAMEILLEHMDWNISLGKDVVISYPKVTRLQSSPCIYPLEQENQMKLAICTGEKEKIRKKTEEFCMYFKSGKLYAPREIKECYVRFLWAFMNTAKEVGMLSNTGLEQQKLLEQIMGAKTPEELETAIKNLLEKIDDREEENPDLADLTVKRAQSLIHEFYQTGITLDEIAAKLNLTPEYLGTRFHKEVGMTFSNYIKNYRMMKAKELLISTNLKLYEIAQKTGYTDPKYFSRVFKDATGQLPADYRKTHK